MRKISTNVSAEKRKKMYLILPHANFLNGSVQQQGFRLVNSIDRAFLEQVGTINGCSIILNLRLDNRLKGGARGLLCMHISHSREERDWVYEGFEMGRDGKPPLYLCKVRRASLERIWRMSWKVLSQAGMLSDPCTTRAIGKKLTVKTVISSCRKPAWRSTRHEPIMEGPLRSWIRMHPHDPRQAPNKLRRHFPIDNEEAKNMMLTGWQAWKTAESAQDRCRRRSESTEKDV